MAQTAAHLVDRVIPPVPVRQWVISVPKRLRCFLADRPNAVAALTRIFIEEIERLLCTAAGPTRAGDRPSVARPRLGAVSFLHRFGSAINHHVHLHACATDGVFAPTGDGPLWRHLGPCKSRVKAYNTDGGWLTWSTDELVADMQRILDRGFDAVKMKLGRPDPREDYERVKAVRKAIGDIPRLMVDVNTVWDLKTALVWGRRLEEF
ncbi:MAG: hypothetical protein EBZ05_10025, partial [Verrucomicrobia bacterium]|nr:hypothetical protein [Verrucomicrobiota bacterium]